MWWMFVLACAAPDPDGESWVVDYVPGDGLLAQQPGCRPTFRLEAAAVEWLRPCGRGDLPGRMNEIDAWADARAYDMGGGGPGTGGTWVVRPGDHDDLFELWFYNHPISEAEDYDAIGVSLMWSPIEGLAAK